MKLYVCTWPNRVSMASALTSSPRLEEFLYKQGFTPDYSGMYMDDKTPVPPGEKVLVEHKYYGHMDNIPTDQKVLVRWSTYAEEMETSREEMIAFCEQHGHVMFYDDCLILSNGAADTRALIEAVEQMLSVAV